MLTGVFAICSSTRSNIRVIPHPHTLILSFANDILVYDIIRVSRSYRLYLIIGDVCVN